MAKPKALVCKLGKLSLDERTATLPISFELNGRTLEDVQAVFCDREIEGRLLLGDDDPAQMQIKGRRRLSMDVLLTTPKKIGYEPKLLGRAKYNLEDEKFVSFELVAVGMRWGLGNCNQRHNPDPAPMGIVFTLAGDSQAERLPPAFISRYGW